MSDGTEYVTLAVVLGIIFGAHFAIRECANAAMSQKRDWWRKAIFLAQQRGEYREFCKQLEEVRDLERMGAE